VRRENCREPLKENQALGEEEIEIAVRNDERENLLKIIIEAKGGTYSSKAGKDWS